MWVSEANWPEAWDYIYFSPIVDEGGQAVVYVGGYPVVKFYKYNLVTDTWTELAIPPNYIYYAMSMSPDRTKLAAHMFNSNQLFIYNTSSGWTTSTAPAMVVGAETGTSQVWATVWADNDTIWCQVRATVGGSVYIKCYKYTVSLDSWDQFTNNLPAPAVNNGKSMSINSAGTALFVGNMGADAFYALKYVIATDTYSTFCIGEQSYIAIDRSAKLWLFGGAPAGIRYYDCDTEALSGTIFPVDTDRDKASDRTCGVYQEQVIIAHHMIAEPKNRSYGELPPLGMAGLNPALMEVLGY